MPQATTQPPLPNAAPEDDASFGAWLGRRRKALGLTQAALAKSCHCSVSALRKIEREERQPSQRLAERIAAQLLIAPAELAEFLAIARGQRRFGQLAGLSAPTLPPLPVSAASGDDAPPEAPSGQDPAQPSIAVLPFLNLSDDAANEHFADGLAEELTDVLAKIPGLRVVSRTSAFSFKGRRDINLPAVGRQLSVATVLEGSVRKAGSRVRITAQLVHAPSDSHLWSQSYERELTDIFAVQDDIARAVVLSLRAALLGEPADGAAAAVRLHAELGAATRGRTANAQAHELVLLGRFLTDRMNATDIATGIGYYRRALQLDPNYALAWAGLAGAYSIQAGYAWAPLAETAELARTAALHAIELEPDLAEGHAELGWVLMSHAWDWNGADRCYARALELGAGSRTIVGAASVLADNLGRKDEAVRLARRAAALDPLSYIAQGNLALRCLNSGLLTEAQAALEQAMKLNPQAALLHSAHGTLLLEQGRASEAMAAFEREPVEVLRLLGRVMAHHAAGRHRECEAAQRELIEKAADEAAVQVAQAFAYRADAEHAFEWLDRAYQQRDPGLAHMQSWPLLRNLHADARWSAFLERMGFTRGPKEQ